MKFLNSKQKEEFLIIASYDNQQFAIDDYRKRWFIETLFKAMKSSGFNLEVTHMYKLERITKLISLMAIAFLWAYKTGVYIHRNIKTIRIKKHQRRKYSVFKYGLVFLANLLLNNCSYREIQLWIKVLSCT